ncbi:hypothetical protein SAMN05216266_11695 [Amycolatopsis marina]|uniref:ORC1/DEAH AAA+ ATPase domain-containing protein n=1 Tax=Amycolatopsis marina TaxID=490629 RepID=A0A1I1BR24_9PSEU|nr:ATP-binding protein [Amycolatopsis marina]SFB52835.1 hypothetical protein SAMN05216266_11695 [Amycolatopsis marina]
MTSTMKNFRCWTLESVSKTVYSDIGQLPADADAVFLAAHTPMILSHLRGEELPDAGSGEEQVLSALLSGVGDLDRNTLIAVTGNSGAGKSHVVRWAHAHLDQVDERFHVLYVPRAVQTIRELLRRIVAGLPGDGGQEFMKRVDAAVGSKSPGELRDRVLEEIRLALTWTLDHHPPQDGEDADQASAREERNNLLGVPDDQGKRRDGLADLLALPQVNRTMLRTDGLLDRVVGSVFEQISRRDGQQDEFTEEDLPIREAGLRKALARNPELADLWSIVVRDPQPALSLLDEAVRHALPSALGLTTHHGETLDILFRQSRQLLRQQGKELVLLFEDLAQFGLIDGELYDQFVIQPGEDFAPLRVLFAVTDGPYAKLEQTVATRITHQFRVESTAVTDHETFVARYLNLVRVGRSDVESSWAEAHAADRDGHWLRNACDTLSNGLPCQFRDECHRAFGAVDVPGLGHVGMYPYNEVALRRAVRGRGEKPTPRDILDVSVREVLIEADVHISNGTYPHPRVRERFDFTAFMPKGALLGDRSGEEADRLYRALVVWGDESSLQPTVAEAFSLSVPPEVGQRTATKARAPSPSPAPAAKATSSDGLARATGSSPLQPLFQWQNGERLPNSDADMYRAILTKMVAARVDLSQGLFHTASGTGSVLLKDLFHGYSFVLEDARGREPAKSSVRFDITRGHDDVRVLMAAKWFADHGHWKSNEGMWPFPEGSDPVELMLTLEQRLDEWADEVRKAFVSRVHGRDLVRAAIGVRAVALLAAGAVTPDKLGGVNDVLQAKIHAAADGAVWERVDQLAIESVNEASAAELIGQFAAVRQGGGDPQLVDIVELESGLSDVLRNPTGHLRWVAETFGDASASLALTARNLVAEIEKAAPAQHSKLVAAVTLLETELDGRRPVQVARAAHDVGRRALETGLFRPADGWADFEEAVDDVAGLPAGLPLGWRGGDDRSEADETLLVQGWGRAAIRGARALALLRDDLAATRVECARNDATAGDIEQHSQELRSRLDLIRQHLDALSSEVDRA